jgi:predicted metal-dependent HD superfamily phosphohydrolase
VTLLDAWVSMFPAAPGIGADLIERWSEPQRHYHTTAHLERMLSVVDEGAGEADDITAVRLATWFHDVVYDPRRTDNEILSAQLAATMLAALDVEKERVAEVVRLIWLTTNHHVEADDHDGALLCDADLAILASSPEAYAAYSLAVRAEYQHVRDDAFRAGRIAVLTKILDLPQIYRLPAHVAAWEARARANVTAEISALRVSAVEGPSDSAG